jgi:predicted ABC-type transport system involved in lysophospholipase L1 biosynthesis ATPase subunit
MAWMIALECAGVRKQHHGLRPLRVNQLVVGPGQRYVLSGFDTAAAEAFVMLVTGASVPDEGDIRVFGASTRDITTDTEWLASLDRIGLVTERAVLLDHLNVLQNLALPITLAVEPLADDVRVRVTNLAREAGLATDRLECRVADLHAADRLRVHLARALAVGPQLLLLEHPTTRVDPHQAEAFGATLRAVGETRGIAWLAITEDQTFARATGATPLGLNAATGALTGAGGFWRRLLLKETP